jgi:hypothetical protein
MQKLISGMVYISLILQQPGKQPLELQYYQERNFLFLPVFRMKYSGFVSETNIYLLTA